MKVDQLDSVFVRNLILPPVSLIQLSFGGVLLGLIVGIIVVYISSKFRDPLADVMLTFVSAYVTFYLAENTVLKCSGKIYIDLKVF